MIYSGKSDLIWLESEVQGVVRQGGLKETSRDWITENNAWYPIESELYFVRCHSGILWWSVRVCVKLVLPYRKLVCDVEV